MMSLALLALLATASLHAGAPAPAPVRKDLPTAEERALFARCAQDIVDVDALLADPAARKSLPTALRFDEAVELQFFVACRALGGAPKGCSSLEGLGGDFKDAEDRCRKIVAKGREARVTLGGGDADAFCRDFAATDPKAPPSAAKACLLVIAAARKGDAGAACPELAKMGLVPKGEDCRASLAYWDGKAQSCAPIKDAFTKRECTETAALVTGLRQPSQCAASAFCLAVPGGPGASCQSLQRSFSARVCARATTARLAESAAREAQERMLKEDEAHATKRAESLARDAELKAKREAERQAAAKKEDKKQFDKGEPMYPHGKEVDEMMRRIEKGLPPKPTPGDKKDAQ